MTKEKELTEIERKQAYLKSYESSIRQMKRSELRIMEMRTKKGNPCIICDGASCTAGQSDLHGYAALLSQEERRYMKARYLCMQRCRKILNQIERLADENEKDVLLYRYIKLHKWEDICEEMHFCWKHIHRIHTSALENFEMT